MHVECIPGVRVGWVITGDVGICANKYVLTTPVRLCSTIPLAFTGEKWIRNAPQG